MATRNDLQEAKNAAALAIKEYHSRHDKEWNAEHEANWTRLNAEHDTAASALSAHLASEQAACERAARLAEIESQQRATTGDRRIGVDAGERRDQNPERIAATRAEVQGMALQAWVRAGKGMELSQEHRTACKAIGINPGSSEIDLNATFRYGKPAWCAQSRQSQREFRVGLDVVTSGAGVETIPEGFMAELERRRLEFAHVRQVCRVVFTASGNPMPWPKVDDTSNSGVKLDEATTIGTSVDPTFSAVTFNAYKYSSKPVFISQELLEDSAFNLSA
jgi:HK97 family phage major capsid protein